MTVVSHYDATLGISIERPADWDVASTPDFTLLVLAPPASGYRSNLGFSRSTPPSQDPAVLDATLDLARAQQATAYPDCGELGVQRFEQDGFPALLQLYRWQAPGAPEPFTQVFGLVLTRDHGLLELNGATLQSLEAQALPAIDAMIRSIRFIPRAR